MERLPRNLTYIECIKISPVVEMTRACHSYQRDDCKDTGGRAIHGAIAEESCIITLGDNYL